MRRTERVYGGGRREREGDGGGGVYKRGTCLAW